MRYFIQLTKQTNHNQLLVIRSCLDEHVFDLFTPTTETIRLWLFLNTTYNPLNTCINYFRNIWLIWWPWLSMQKTTASCFKLCGTFVYKWHHCLLKLCCYSTVCGIWFRKLLKNFASPMFIYNIKHTILLMISI